MTTVEDKLRSTFKDTLGNVTAAKGNTSQVWGYVVFQGAKKLKIGLDGINCEGQSVADVVSELDGRKIIAISPYGADDDEAELVIRVGKKKWTAKNAAQATKILKEVSDLSGKVTASLEEVTAAPAKKGTKFKLEGVTFTEDHIPLVFKILPIKVSKSSGKATASFDIYSNRLKPGPKNPTEMEQRRVVLKIALARMPSRNVTYKLGTTKLTATLRSMLRMADASWMRYTASEVNKAVSQVIKDMKAVSKGKAIGGAIDPAKPAPASMTFSAMVRMAKKGETVPYSKSNFDALIKGILKG